MKKRILSILLAVLMLLPLVSCGSEGGDKGPGVFKQKGFVFRNEDASIGLESPSDPLDPEEVYDNLTYVPEMFYGDYSLVGGDRASEKFGNETTYFTWTQDGEELSYSTLPFRMQAGESTLAHSLSYVKEHDWMRLYFMRKLADESSVLDMVLGAYTVEGNKLVFKPLETFNVDKENNEITYEFSEEVWEYEFRFKGRTLTLKANEAVIDLHTCLDAYREVDYAYTEAYLCPDSKSADHIDYIRFRYDSQDLSSYLSVDMTDGTSVSHCIAKLEENGLLTLTLDLDESEEKQIVTYQYVYFCGSDDGLVLTDGENTYYYNDSFSERNFNELNKFVGVDQTAKLEELNETQLEMLVEKKENLMEDLVKAFEEANIKVTVNANTGELAMDASVLFGGDSTVLTDAGKTFLDQFIKAYSSIVFSEKYDGFITKTMVEGHAAPVAGDTYEDSLPFSKERADNVKNYCVSIEGVDSAKLAEGLESIGYSNSRPVLDADGNVDMAASRRVSFRFVIDLDQI